MTEGGRWQGSLLKDSILFLITVDVSYESLSRSTTFDTEPIATESK